MPENILQYLPADFVAQLTPEARKKLLDIKMDENPGLLRQVSAFVRGRGSNMTSYNPLTNSIYLAPGVSPNTAAHEALHSLTNQGLISLDPGSYFQDLTPDERENLKRTYYGTDQYNLGQNIEWAFQRFNETIPTSYSGVRGDLNAMDPQVYSRLIDMGIFMPKVSAPTGEGPQSIDDLLAAQTAKAKILEAAGQADENMLRQAARMQQANMPETFLTTEDVPSPAAKLASLIPPQPPATSPRPRFNKRQAYKKPSVPRFRRSTTTRKRIATAQKKVGRGLQEF